MTSVLLIIFGILIIVFSKGFSKKIIEFQNNTFNYSFGEKEISVSRVVVVITGVVFIFFAILDILGI